jgi:hypothetical protein
MKYLFLLLLIGALGCNPPAKQADQTKPLSKADSLKLKRAAADKEWEQDSLKNEAVAKDVIAYIKHRKITELNTKLKLWKDTSTSAEVIVGNLFSNKIKHLVIKTFFGWHVNLYVYRLNDLVLEFRDDWSNLDYLGTDIKDINGDGIKDFITNWENASGCCRRDHYYVYLYKRDDTFSEQFDFINPTFYPKQKLVLGVSYGHPGEVPLYKYKWNGFKVDTIEYIYPANKSRHKFYRAKNYDDLENPKKREVLTAIPKEYKKIPGYDWFMSY